MQPTHRPTLLTALLACLFFVFPVAAQVPDVPPYNRADSPGEPPAVPGNEPEVQGRGPDPRGLCPAGHRRRPAGAGRGQATARADHRDAARPETAGRQRGLDPRLLGLGCRSRRLLVGQRVLARHAGQSALGARLLDGGGAGLPLGFGPLGRCQPDPDAVPAGAAGNARPRPLGACSRGGVFVCPGHLAPGRRPLAVAAGLLVFPAGRLRLHAGPLHLDAARLRLCAGVLGSAVRLARACSSRRSTCRRHSTRSRTSRTSRAT